MVKLRYSTTSCPESSGLLTMGSRLVSTLATGNLLLLHCTLASSLLLPHPLEWVIPKAAKVAGQSAHKRTSVDDGLLQWSDVRKAPACDQDR
jgi:hypothetical protein